MSTQQEMLRLSALTFLAEKIAKEIAATKARVAADIGVGGRAVAQVDGEIIGSMSASKPRQGAPIVVDEDQAVAWLVEQYGESAFDALVSTRPRLTAQGKKDVQAAAKRGEVPGVEVPPPGKSALAFTLAAEADELVPAMLRTGVLSTEDLLGIEAA